MVEEVAVRLVQQYDMTIVTGRYDRRLPHSEIWPSGIRIVRVGLGCRFDQWLYPFLAALQVYRLRPDIVHAVLETFAGLALYLYRGSARTILTLQTTNRSFFKGPILRRPDRVTAISQALVEIARRLGRSDVTLIRNGIDVHGIRTACRQHAKVPGRMLFVGRLEPMKGVDTLVRAMSDQRLATSNWTLRIVGGGSQEASLKALAQTLGISDRVTFTGRLAGKAVFDEYAQAEIFCGLSRSEALGNVFLEAQAAGCAVVATNVGGIPEIVEDGATGLLVSPDHPEEAGAALARLLTDRQLRSQLIERAQSQIEGSDWGRVAHAYSQVLA